MNKRLPNRESLKNMVDELDQDNVMGAIMQVGRILEGQRELKRTGKNLLQAQETIKQANNRAFKEQGDMRKAQLTDGEIIDMFELLINEVQDLRARITEA